MHPTNKYSPAVIAAMLMGMASGELRTPRITDGNRVFRDRAPDGSPEAQARIAAAAAKRQRKALKRGRILEC